MARIELREFDIGQSINNFMQNYPTIQNNPMISNMIKNLKATHQFLVKYDDNNNKVELHGVAVNPSTGKFNPYAINNAHLLKAAAYPPIDSHPQLTINSFNGLYQVNQLSEVLLTGTEEEVNQRWDAAINAGEVLNSRTDLKYAMSGGTQNNYCSGNSNSVIATLEIIMGFNPHKLDSRSAAPGLDKNLLSTSASEEYKSLHNLEWCIGNDYKSDQQDQGMFGLASSAETFAPFFENYI